RKPGPTPTPDPRLLVIDAATTHRPPDRGRLDWTTLNRTILDAWTTFDRDGDLPEQPGIHRSLPVIDLLDDEVDLAPGRHLPPPAETTGTAALATVHQNLRNTLRRTHDLAPGPTAPTQADTDTAPHWSTITIGELARTGALEIHTATTRVITDQPETEQPDRHTCLLRPDPEALDPWFLAGFLRSTANTRQASSYASTATRIDVRRLKVPRLPLTAQRRYGRRFQDLAAFETALQHAADLGRQLIQGTVDGLTDGTLTPGD
ncbi:SAM-dependent methyltransferase, partial [Streptomyces sp. DSM 44938]|nr:SAM-dependent methyltransferase [Streptomyces sp. DSM 44938]